MWLPSLRFGHTIYPYLLEQQPEIDKVSSIVNVVEDMHQAMHENKQEYLKIPDNDVLISQYFFIYDGDDAYELVNREFDHARVLLSVNEHTSSRLTQLMERIEQ